MNDQLNELVFIIDNSGSMEKNAQATCDGFNELIQEQKKLPVDVKVTTVLFNDEVKIIHNGENLRYRHKLTPDRLQPNGMTALCDAVCTTIDKVGERLANTPEDQRPGKILVVIITDGHENSSKEFNMQNVKARITHQREKYNWEFMFIGANIDTAEYGKNMGIAAVNTVSFKADLTGTMQAYSGATRSIKAYFTTGSTDMSAFNN